MTPATPCLITITGGAAGSGTLTAAATGYTSAVDNVTVLASGNVVYGSLEFTTANLALLPGASAPMTLQLVDSSNVSNLVVSLSSDPRRARDLHPDQLHLLDGRHQQLHRQRHRRRHRRHGHDLDRGRPDPPSRPRQR